MVRGVAESPLCAREKTKQNLKRLVVFISGTAWGRYVPLGQEGMIKGGGGLLDSFATYVRTSIISLFICATLFPGK
jgi:hypothetical protein